MVTKLTYDGNCKRRSKYNGISEKKSVIILILSHLTSMARLYPTSILFSLFYRRTLKENVRERTSTGPATFSSIATHFSLSHLPSLFNILHKWRSLAYKSPVSSKKHYVHLQSLTFSRSALTVMKNERFHF